MSASLCPSCDSPVSGVTVVGDGYEASCGCTLSRRQYEELVGEEVRQQVRRPTANEAGVAVVHSPNSPSHLAEYRVEQTWPTGEAEPLHVGDASDALALAEALLGLVADDMGGETPELRADGSGETTYLTDLQCTDCMETVTIAHSGGQTQVCQSAPWPDVECCPKCGSEYPDDLGAAIREVRGASVDPDPGIRTDGGPHGVTIPAPGPILTDDGFVSESDTEGEDGE